VKRIIVILLAIGYPIYFGFAMKLNPPFNFPSNVSEKVILDDYVFTNNIGLALFVLTVSVALMLLWELLVKRFSKPIKRTLTPGFKIPAFISKYFRWYATSFGTVLFN
jgi:hypothetical protein